MEVPHRQGLPTAAWGPRGLRGRRERLLGGDYVWRADERRERLLRVRLYYGMRFGMLTCMVVA